MTDSADTLSVAPPVVDTGIVATDTLRQNVAIADTTTGITVSEGETAIPPIAVTDTTLTENPLPADTTTAPPVPTDSIAAPVDTLHAIIPTAAQASSDSALTTIVPPSDTLVQETAPTATDTVHYEKPTSLAPSAADTLAKPFAETPRPTLTDTAAFFPFIADTSAFGNHVDTTAVSTTEIPTIPIYDGRAGVRRNPELPFKDGGLFVLLFAELVLFFIFFLRRKEIVSWQTDGDTTYTRTFNHNKRLSGMNFGLRTLFLLYTFLVEGSLAAVLLFTQNVPLPFGGGFARHALILALPFALFFLLQQGIYLLLTNVFAANAGGREWCDRHLIINLLLGIGIFPFTLLAAYLPESNTFCLFSAITLYLIARLLFILAGAKLFLQDFSSLLYFILYLCALEIAPLFFLVKTATLF